MPARRGIAKFGAQLPGTPCSQEMYNKMLAIAEEKKVSLAEVQRAAFSLFLSQIDKNTVNDDKKIVSSSELVIAR